MSKEDDFEEKARNQSNERYFLRLYVAGITPKSQKAIGNLKRLLNEYDNIKYELEIIDIYQNPITAQERQIIAAPTLIKELPAPVRRFIGDMSDTKKIILGLDLKKKQE
jgi:circadian clock protein KaiB